MEKGEGKFEKGEETSKEMPHSFRAKLFPGTGNRKRKSGKKV